MAGWAVLVLVLVLVVVLVVLAGCGGSSGNGVASKSASEILEASRTAAKSASSVRVMSRSAQGPLVVSVDLELASNGGRARVSLLGVSFEAIRIAETLYVKGSPSFDARLAASTGVHVPPGTWVKGPAGSAHLSQLRSFTDASELELLLSAVNPVKGASTTINGQPAIELKESGKLYSGALYIATTGQPYPIKSVKHGRETSQTTFTDWNQPITITAPTNTTTIK